MKTHLFVVFLCVLAHHFAQVDGLCVSCKYLTERPKCTDTYVPSGPEKDICKGPIDGQLCRKYDGGYTIYCESGGSTVTCSKKQSPCPNKAGQYQPLYPVVILMAVLVAKVTRFRL